MTTRRLITVLCLLTGIFGLVWCFASPWLAAPQRAGDAPRIAPRRSQSRRVTPTRTAQMHLIPDGYTGWVRLVYEAPNATPLPIANGYKVIRYNDLGFCYTSEKPEAGRAYDIFYYVRSDGKGRKLDSSMIHHQTTVRTDSDFVNGKIVRWHYAADFFVGSPGQAADQFGDTFLTNPSMHNPLLHIRRSRQPQFR